MSAVQEWTMDGWLPEQVANGSHGHWSRTARQRADARQRAFLEARVAKIQPAGNKAKLEITLVFPTARRRDTDNLYARVKGIVDGLVSAGVLVDDDTEHLELAVKALTVPGCKGVTLRVQSLGPDFCETCGYYPCQCELGHGAVRIGRERVASTDLQKARRMTNRA